MSEKKKNGPVEELLNELTSEGFVDEVAPGEEEQTEIDIDRLVEEDELEVLRNERNQMQDRLMRALAEAENARKRGERDRRDAEVYGGAKLARDLLSVHDNMKRAVSLITDEQRQVAKPVIEGIELTIRELITTFAKHKILPVNPDIGAKFDPKVHQAMFEAPVPNIKSGHIIQCMAEGFVIGDRLLRPAQVGVSSNPGKVTAPQKEPQDEEQE